MAGLIVEDVRRMWSNDPRGWTENQSRVDVELEQGAGLN